MPAFLGRRRRPPVAWPEEKDKICRLRRQTKCKGHCPIGWKQVGYAGFGCCDSFSSCGGYRKVCEKVFKCQDRRRSEDDHERGAIEEMEAPPAEESQSEAKEVSPKSANSDAEG